MAVPHLQFGALRVESHQVQRIAMAHAGVIQSTAIVIYRHRAVGNLVATVAIHISHTQVVVTLSGIAVQGLAILANTLVIGVEHPVLLQFVAVPIPGSQHRTGVITATEDGRGMLAIQIAHSSQHTIRTVGIVIAPVAQVTTCRHVGFGSQSLTR